MLEGRKLLELCSGTRSASKVWESMGGSAVSVDSNPNLTASWTIDILSWSKRAWIVFLDREGPFDFVWASPDCKCFSIANGRQFEANWGKFAGSFIPQSEEAKLACELVKRCIWIAETNRLMWLKPWGYWLVENPRGLLRKMNWMKRHQRDLVTYCQYGDTRMKPTDLWGIFPRTWNPKSCKNGSPCHEGAPRGSTGGTIGLTYEDRIKIPALLFTELFTHAHNCDGLARWTLEDFE
jgi:hypothetical protein